MKKALLLAALTLLFVPSVSSAAFIDDLRAQVQSLTAIVQSLQVKLASLTKAKVPATSNLASATTSTSSSVSSPQTVVVTSPNGGEVFTRGSSNVISWRGGKNKVQVGIVQSSATTNTNLLEGRNLVGWLSVSAAPNSSLTWDGRNTCDLSMKTCQSVPSGNYKVFVLSEDASGNMTGWNYQKNTAGNVDASDLSFTLR